MSKSGFVSSCDRFAGATPGFRTGNGFVPEGTGRKGKVVKVGQSRHFKPAKREMHPMPSRPSGADKAEFAAELARLQAEFFARGGKVTVK